MAKPKPAEPPRMLPLRFAPSLVDRLQTFAKSNGLSVNKAATALIDRQLHIKGY